ncbi:MAG: hypothetical protein WBA46_06425 [Thermomicrobiales bacterium]
MASTSFPRYQRESVVKRAIEQHIETCDARLDRSEERSTRHYLTGVVADARATGDGRYTIGTINDELEGIIYTVIWDPGSDVVELRAED